LKTALGKYPSLKIFGTDYKTPDGTAIRDYIHIDDLSNAHLLALKYLKKRQESRIFNCGYGKGYSVQEVIQGAKEVTGIDFQVAPADRRKGDPPVLIADSKLIRQTLNWKPHFNDLHYILKTAWNWEKKLNSQQT
jgi:UDP-glucose 4-epimerase